MVKQTSLEYCLHSQSFLKIQKHSHIARKCQTYLHGTGIFNVRAAKIYVLNNVLTSLRVSLHRILIYHTATGYRLKFNIPGFKTLF